jgi:endogenous inhibitor of DNA gyrase (YacG/DUF329 family)
MTTRTCPICRKGSATAPYAPFCSKRCADVDLQRWFSGVYAVPAVEQDEAEEGGGADPMDG